MAQIMVQSRVLTAQVASMATENQRLQQQQQAAADAANEREARLRRRRSAPRQRVQVQLPQERLRRPKPKKVGRRALWCPSGHRTISPEHKRIGECSA